MKTVILNFQKRLLKSALSNTFFARFQVKKKQFFRNFMTIMLFGAIGTLISFVIISLGKNLNQLP